jgi:hypothetical protein
LVKGFNVNLDGLLWPWGISRDPGSTVIYRPPPSNPPDHRHTYRELHQIRGLRMQPNRTQATTLQDIYGSAIANPTSQNDSAAIAPPSDDTSPSHDAPPPAPERVPPRPRPILWAFQYLVLLSLATLFGSLALGLFSTWRTGSNLLTRLTAPQPEAQVDVRSVVVQQVRGVSELTTAVFAMESVVPTRRDRTLAGYTVGSTTLLYIAYGEVRAGVDLSQIQPSNIQVVGDEITVTLPPPQILDSKIDVTRSSVYDYDRGFLGLGPDVAPELQQLAQTETLHKIVEAACQDNLLGEASLRAELAVTQLLTTAGYRSVTVESQPPAADACRAPVPTLDARVSNP